MSQHSTADTYFVPEGSVWPMLMTISLVIFVSGFAAILNGNPEAGNIAFGIGLVCVIVMSYIWLRGVVREAEGGKYNMQVDRTYRWSMAWFIFSEVMFFGAFFGALFYARVLSLPWLGGAGPELMTNEVLWQGFENVWPSNGPALLGGDFSTIPAWGLPFINTLLLLTSGITCTIAHHGLKEGNHAKATRWLAATVALGSLFLYFQATEYIEAYQHLNLTLGSGIYGSTFFMLTGFHGMHVTLGTIMLFVIMCRTAKGHFTPDRHFGFEGVAWYWHFVDVVWVGLFIFVYVI